MLTSERVRHYAALGFMLFGSVTCGLANPITIGYFTDDQTLCLGAALGCINAAFGTNSTAANAPADIGGQREFALRRTLGTSTIQMDANESVPGTLNLNVNTGSRALGLITWDGAEATAVAAAGFTGSPITGVCPACTATLGSTAAQRGQPNTYTLGGTGVDFTDGGDNLGIEVQGFSDQGVSILLRFYQAAGVFASVTLYIDPDPEGDMHAYLIPFGSFVGEGGSASAIVQDTAAITLEIIGNQRNAVDLTLRLVAATDVPEPGTFLLLGGAMAGLAVWARRRRTA